MSQPIIIFIHFELWIAVAFPQCEWKWRQFPLHSGWQLPLSPPHSEWLGCTLTKEFNIPCAHRRRVVCTRLFDKCYCSHDVTSFIIKYHILREQRKISYIRRKDYGLRLFLSKAQNLEESGSCLDTLKDGFCFGGGLVFQLISGIQGWGCMLIICVQTLAQGIGPVLF